MPVSASKEDRLSRAGEKEDFPHVPSEHPGSPTGELYSPFKTQGCSIFRISTVSLNGSRLRTQRAAGRWRVKKSSVSITKSLPEAGTDQRTQTPSYTDSINNLSCGLLSRGLAFVHTGWTWHFRRAKLRGVFSFLSTPINIPGAAENRMFQASSVPEGPCPCFPQGGKRPGSQEARQSHAHI